MKTNIICLIIVNILCIGFIMFTVYSQFGTNISVLESVDSVPVEVGYVHHKTRSRAGPVSGSVCMVRLRSDRKPAESFWVNAKDVFGTEDKSELNAIIEKESAVKLNIFVDPESDEILGVTKDSTSILAMIYQNNKLVKYGSIILPGVDIFIVIVMLISSRGRKKAVKGNT